MKSRKRWNLTESRVSPEVLAEVAPGVLADVAPEVLAEVAPEVLAGVAPGVLDCHDHWSSNCWPPGELPSRVESSSFSEDALDSPEVG